MTGQLSESEIERLLREQEFARLGCCADSQVYVVPITYAFDHTRLVGQTTPGRKIEMMRKNPHVCVEVDDVRGPTDWRSVILWGEFRELRGMDAVRASGLLIDRFSEAVSRSPDASRRGREATPPRVNHTPHALIVYEIAVTERTGRFERPEE